MYLYKYVSIYIPIRFAYSLLNILLSFALLCDSHKLKLDFRVALFYFASLSLFFLSLPNSLGAFSQRYAHT